MSTVATLAVAAGATAKLSLEGLQGDPALQNTFEVVSDAAPGAVLVKVSSKSKTGVHWVEMPGKDLQNVHNAGNHPWTVADGTDSTMLLFNELTTPEKFTVILSSGESVWKKSYTLAAQATQSIDINKILSDQVKDDSGVVLPKGLQQGQANWWEAQQFGGTGRVLQSNAAKSIARNFSCGEHSVISGGDFYPATTSEPVGETNEFGELDAEESLTESSGCSGDYVGDSNTFTYIWSSDNTSIAAISGAAGGSSVDNIDLKGISAGTANISGQMSDQYGCGYYLFAQETITSDQTPVITDIEPNLWPAGQTTTVTVTGMHFGTNLPALTYSDPNITTAAISSYGDTQIILSVAVASGTPNENVTITVTSNGYGGSAFTAGSGGQSAASLPATANVLTGCFAQLKYRKVISAAGVVANHSYWWFNEGNSYNLITEAGPSGSCPLSCGYLNSWANPGNVGAHYPEDDANVDSVAWTAPSGPNLCSQAAQLLLFEEAWQQNTTPYALGAAPNSNTFAHQSGNAAGFVITTPPPNAPGW